MTGVTRDSVLGPGHTIRDHYPKYNWLDASPPHPSTGLPYGYRSPFPGVRTGHPRYIPSTFIFSFIHSVCSTARLEGPARSRICFRAAVTSKGYSIEVVRHALTATVRKGIPNGLVTFILPQLEDAVAAASKSGGRFTIPAGQNPRRWPID